MHANNICNLSIFPTPGQIHFNLFLPINNFIDKEIDELVYPDRKTKLNFEEFYKINNKFKLTKIKHTKNTIKAKHDNKLIYIFNHFLR